LKAGAPLIRMESLRLADRTPICVGTTWLSAERFPDAGRVYERARSMTKLLAHYGVRDFRRASTRITAAIADATDVARLDLALGHPVLVVDSTDVDLEGTPLLTKRIEAFVGSRGDEVAREQVELCLADLERVPAALIPFAKPLPADRIGDVKQMEFVSDLYLRDQ
jgi:hypothetical protein